MTSSVVASDRMGGKQEPTQSNQTSKAGQMAATQEQLRLARITQEASKDEDQAIIQKAIRKVIEATRCSQSAAEIALYDADNDVGTAIMAVLDQPPTDDWHEQKSRKAKKQSADNHDDEDNRDMQRTDRRHGGRSGSSAAARNGNEAPRFRSRGGGGNKNGAGRGAREYDGEADFQQASRRDDDPRNSRGRGGRGGAQERGRGRGRGRFGDKGSGGPSMAAIGTWDGGAGNSTNDLNPLNHGLIPSASAWDNSMAKQNNEKDMVWQNSMAGGHKQRDGAAVNGEEWTGANDDTLNGEDTDWKNVGTLVFQRKEETEVTTSTPSFASVARLPKPSEQPPPASTQQQQHQQQQQPPQQQTTKSVGDSHSITGSATSQQQQQSAYGVRNNNAIVTSLLNQQPTSETFRSTVAPSPPRNPGNATSWTQQLKNDLGIGRAPVSSVPSQAGASRQTVEFVSDDGRDDSSALPEYQFGFHVEAPSVTPQQQQQQQSHDYSSTSASVDAVLFPTRTSKSDAVLDSVRGPANFSQTSTAVNGSMSKDNSKNTAASIQSSYGSMQMPSVTAVATAPKAMSMGQSTASIQPTLAYADTTTISYPDASRGVYAMNNQQFATSQAVTSTYSQSSNKNSTTTTSKAPLANPMFNTNVQQMYNPTFPYMNLYSPVTTVRPDDPQQQFAAAALLQQYPFMPQMDLSSMLPPVVASGAQQQSRNDQSNNYADVLGDYNKTYNAGRGDTQTSVSSNVAPPPGFSGPPSNVAAAAAAQAAFGIPQGNFTSLFQNPMLPPTYHHQMPLSFMLPNMAGNGQNPVNLQQKLTQPQMFTQSTFDDQNQANQQQQDYGRSAQSGPIQSFSQQQQQQGNKGGSAGYANAGNDSKSVYGGGSHGQLSKGTFERSNYTTTATATPPPNQMSGLNQYAPPVAFNPNAHMTGFAANAGYGSAQLQQLSPMAMPGAHMHDARASGQQSGVKHGGTMQQSKYAGQTGSYGTWA